MSQQIVVKGYQIVKKIDQFGLKIMYRATHILTGTPVFITVIPARPGVVLDALVRRAEQGKKLTHRNLVTPLEYGYLNNEYFYYTTAAIPSSKLSDILEQIEHYPDYWFRFSGYFMQILNAISYLHAAKLTHRDITSANIRVDRNDRILIEGFINPRPKIENRNIASIVSLPYISPEQLCGAPVDFKTDIYSLGVVMYELITDMLPYDSNYVKIDEAAKGTIPRISEHRFNVPEELELIAYKALSPRDMRYQHIEGWIRDLGRFHAKRPLRLKLKDFSQSLKQMFVFKS